MAKNIVTGIDIGSATVKVMVAERASATGSPKVLGAGEAEIAGMRRGCVVDVEEVSKSIREAVQTAEKISGVPIKHAFISFGGIGLGSLRGRGVVAVSRADSEITENDIARALDISQAQISSLPNREIIHSHPLCYTIDDSLVARNPIGMTGARLEVETIFTTGSQQHMNNLIKSVEGAGISVDDIVAIPFAAAHAVLSKKQKEAGVALLDIGDTTSSFIVFEEGVPLSVDVFSVGSGHITNDLAIAFKVSLEEAENMKCDFGQEKMRKNKIGDIIEARLSDIFELADKHLKKIGRNRLLPAGIVITGGGANLSGIVEFAKKGMQLPVEIGEPTSLQSNYPSLQNPQWSASAGLCMIGLDDNINDLGRDILGRTNSVVVKWLKAFLP